ncbi:MAG: cytidylate kinase-like family protein [Thermodesulfobacteriota bacterium]
MSVITISRGSYSYGKEVAEKVAMRLGYECIAREVLLEASEQFNIPQVKLIRAFEEAPSLWDRLRQSKERYIAFIEVALLRQFQKDNVVYHGLAGHFFVKGVSHVLKVRIIADLEERIRVVMERDKISRKEALRFLEKIDEERRRWSRHLYGIDSSDPGLYDLVIHIRKYTADDAVELITHSLGLKRFETTPDSRRAMDNLLLAAEAKAVLIDKKPDARVLAQDGVVHVMTKAHREHEESIIREIEGLLSPVKGVTKVKVHVMPITPFDM